MHQINMCRLESRPNKRSTDVDFFVDFNGNMNQENVRALLKDLRSNTKDVHILESKKGKQQKQIQIHSNIKYKQC
jgi:prephenate dehydratase